jgi:hypothetical protein
MISEGEAHFYSGVEDRPEFGVLLDTDRIVIDHVAVIMIVIPIKFTCEKLNLNATSRML